MSASAKWGDLSQRMASGFVLALIGVVAVRLGGPWFLALATVAAGLMIWELATMLGAGSRAFAVLALGAAAMVAGRQEACRCRCQSPALADRHCERQGHTGRQGRI